MTSYILDGSAVVSLLNREMGADGLAGYYIEAANGRAEMILNKITLFEVYNGYRLADGESYADQLLALIRKSHIKIIDVISDDLMRLAAKLRFSHKQLSVGDAFAVAQTILSGGELISANHRGFDEVEMSGTAEIVWMR
jgi:predicted nucleic acid-binding protein